MFDLYAEEKLLKKPSTRPPCTKHRDEPLAHQSCFNSPVYRIMGHPHEDCCMRVHTSIFTFTNPNSSPRGTWSHLSMLTGHLGLRRLVDGPGSRTRLRGLNRESLTSSYCSASIVLTHIGVSATPMPSLQSSHVSGRSYLLSARGRAPHLGRFLRFGIHCSFE